MSKKKKLIIILISALIIILSFSYRKVIFDKKEVIEVFYMEEENFLELSEIRGISTLKMINWKTGETLWKSKLPKASYDTNNFRNSKNEYSVIHNNTFIYRFYRYYEIEHRKLFPRHFQFAINLDNGDLIWLNEYDNDKLQMDLSLRTYISDSGILINSSSLPDNDSALLLEAYNSSDGTKLWDKEINIDFHVISSQVVADKLILNQINSTLIYSFSDGNLLNKIGHEGSILILDDSIIFKDRSKRFYLYDLNNNKTNALATINDISYGSVAIYKGNIISFYQNKELGRSDRFDTIFKVNLITGEELWRTDISSNGFISDLFINDVVRDNQNFAPFKILQNRYMPLICRRDIFDERDFLSFLIVDLETGAVTQSEQIDHNWSDLLMSEIIKVDGYYYINLRIECCILVFNSNTGKFVRAFTVKWLASDKEYYSFPIGAMDFQGWVHHIDKNYLYYFEKNPYVIDLTTGTIEYTRDEELYIHDRTEEIFNKYGLW